MDSKPQNIKVNLKKYLPIDGRWQFVPILKVDGKPKPDAVLIGGQAVKGTTGRFYIEWRDPETGKRVQKPVGSSPREALDAWKTKIHQFETGEVPDDLDEESAAPATRTSVKDAASKFLLEVKATKSEGTHDAYTADLEWFSDRLGPKNVMRVTREDVIRLLGIGRDEKLQQASINRRVMVGMMAVRSAGSTLKLKKGDWPKVPETDVEVYEPDEIQAFFGACSDERERLIFQVFLFSGFRMREVSTMRWMDIDWHRNTLAVVARQEYEYSPKNYEVRKVTVPGELIESLKRYRRRSKGKLVFPSLPHPKRPKYGGDAPDAHHLELCKVIAHRAGLNCGHCVSGTIRKKKCADGPNCGRWYLHKWRHTYATNMLQSGLDLKSLQKVLGHKNLATTEKYLKAVGSAGMTEKVESSLLTAYL